MYNKFIAMLSAFILLMAFSTPVAFASTETVTTTLYLNIQSILSFEVTLLGEGAVTSSAGGQATASNIEFNSSGSSANIQAKVTGGGTTQTDGNPILVVDNVGTVNIEPLNISINSNVPACWKVYYSATFTADCSGGTELTTTEIEVDSSFTPAEAVKNLYLCGNTTACTSGDETTRTFTIEGTGTE
jgi:hypothetical protein